MTPDLTALRAHVQAHASICAVERSLLDMLEAEQQRAQRLQGLAFQLITETPGMDTKRVEAAAGRAVDMQERLEAAEANVKAFTALHQEHCGQHELLEAQLARYEKVLRRIQEHPGCELWQCGVWAAAALKKAPADSQGLAGETEGVTPQ